MERSKSRITLESDIVTCATSFFWWEGEIETEQLQGTVVDKIEIGKHAVTKI